MTTAGRSAWRTADSARMLAIDRDTGAPGLGVSQRLTDHRRRAARSSAAGAERRRVARPGARRDAGRAAACPAGPGRRGWWWLARSGLGRPAADHEPGRLQAARPERLEGELGGVQRAETGGDDHDDVRRGCPRPATASARSASVPPAASSRTSRPPAPSTSTRSWAARPRAPGRAASATGGSCRPRPGGRRCRGRAARAGGRTPAWCRRRRAARRRRGPRARPGSTPVCAGLTAATRSPRPLARAASAAVTTVFADVGPRPGDQHDPPRHAALPCSSRRCASRQARPSRAAGAGCTCPPVPTPYGPVGVAGSRHVGAHPHLSARSRRRTAVDVARRHVADRASCPACLLSRPQDARDARPPSRQARPSCPSRLSRPQDARDARPPSRTSATRSERRQPRSSRRTTPAARSRSAPVTAALAVSRTRLTPSGHRRRAEAARPARPRRRRPPPSPPPPPAPPPAPTARRPPPAAPPRRPPAPPRRPAARRAAVRPPARAPPARRLRPPGRGRCRR